MTLLASPPGAVIEPRRRAFGSLVGLAAALVVLIAWFAAVAGTGSGSSGTARWCLAVAAAVLLPGFAVVRAGRRASAPLVEDLAWAAPAGLCVAMLGWFTDRFDSAVGAFGLGPLLVVALLLVPVTRRRILARPAPGWGSGPALVLAVVQLIVIGWMLRTGLMAYHADPGAAGTIYYPDLMYNLSLAGELRHHVMPTYPPVAGATLSYHWFLFAVTDHLTTGTGVDLFDATLRLGPASVVPASIMIVAVVARRLADRIWAGPLAAVLLGAIELSQASRWTTRDGSINLLPYAWFTSTPQAMGWVAGLAAGGAVIAFLRHSAADRAVPVILLAPFLVLAAGAKSAELAVIIAGLALTVVVAAVRRNRSELVRALAALALAGAVFEAASRTIYAGSSYGVHLRWFAAPLDEISAYFPGYSTRVTPLYMTGHRYSHVALLATSVLWVLPLLPRLGGLLFQVRYRPDAASWFCAGTAAAGFGLAFVAGHPAGSEVYFMQSGYPIGVAAAASGIVLAAGRVLAIVPATTRRRVAALFATLAVVGGLSACVIALAQPDRNPVQRLREAHPGAVLSHVVSVRYLAWLWLEPMAWLIGVIVVLTAGTVVVWHRLTGTGGPRRAVAGLAVLSAALGAGAFTMALFFHGTVVPVDESPADIALRSRDLISHGALPTTRDTFRAGAYVNAHAGKWDVVATNMYCRSDRAHRAAQGVRCDARNFVASAVTQRHTLVGGWAYADRNVAGAWSLIGRSYKNAHFWDPALYAEQYRAVGHPTRALLDHLYRRFHVRWLFVDLRDPPVDVGALDRLATARFVGPAVEVWQLRPPARG